jgi:hypothetical protein
MSKHPITHIEISTNDRLALGAFYKSLFDWETTDMPEMNYMTFTTGEGVGGGFNPVGEDNPPGTITFYVDTDDVTASLKKAESLGATILTPESDIPGVGKYGFFRDPSGNMIGLIKPLPRPG